MIFFIVSVNVLIVLLIVAYVALFHEQENLFLEEKKLAEKIKRFDEKREKIVFAIVKKLNHHGFAFDPVFKNRNFKYYHDVLDSFAGQNKRDTHPVTEELEELRLLENKILFLCGSYNEIINRIEKLMLKFPHSWIYALNKHPVPEKIKLPEHDSVKF